MWGILEEAAKPASSARSADAAAIGDYFAACMDEAAIEARGLSPLAADLARIDASEASTKTCRHCSATCTRACSRAGCCSTPASQQDARDATKVITASMPAGSDLPDRDYYIEGRRALERDSDALRAARGEDVRACGRRRPTQAAAQAATVVRIETTLANASLTRVEQRDPYNIYHRATLAELQNRRRASIGATYFAAARLQARAMAQQRRAEVHARR